MPKKKSLGQYHYAIQTLESRLVRLKKNPDKHKKAEQRIASMTAALAVLRTNNLPEVTYDSKVPLVFNKEGFLEEYDEGVEQERYAGETD